MQPPSEGSFPAEHDTKPSPGLWKRFGSDIPRDPQAPAFGSELIFRGYGREAVLSAGNFLGGLEEFEICPFREQRLEMGDSLAKVLLIYIFPSGNCIICY